MHSLARLIRALALVALVPSWLGLLGGWHWLLDLCAHFRWQYLVASVFVVVWATWQKWRKVSAFAVLTLLLNAFLVGRVAWHSPPADSVAKDFSLRVLSLNVYTANQNTQAVLEHLMSSDADVVFLMEVGQKWAVALESLAAKYPYRIAEPRPDNFGLALFSRIPWEEQELLWFGGARVPSVQIRLKHQGRELVIIGTHPVPPIGAQYSGWRDQQLELLSRHVVQASLPVLVVGDLNSTPWSAGMRFATSGNLDFRSVDPPWVPTWRARSVFAIPIDHALATAPLVISHRVVGPDVGSDHRSLAVSVGWGK